MASPPHDVEMSTKAAGNVVVGDKMTRDEVSQEFPALHVPSYLQKCNARMESLAGFESRGITRVMPEERSRPSLASDVQVAVLWFSANVSVNNLAVGLFGPLVFDLGFLDSALCATFGGLIGSLSTSYMSIWGPLSGNRTMVSCWNKFASTGKRSFGARKYPYDRVPGRCPIFYGVLALENPVLLEYCADDWILHN